MRSLVIHAHFYQPPRENPYWDEVDVEFSAAPYHDWNTRIERECYRTVTAARVLGGDGRIDHIVNTLERLSFNVGPTLLEWMERHAPDTYRRILDADRASCQRLQGHGNAIAQPYHHVILPLASRRDKVTEVKWGIADFKRRFGRAPEGMWLPETAVDDETLDVLAEHGIRFTILAPYQVRNAPPFGHPGRYTTANGRTIALVPYDGGMSHGIAFGDILRDAWSWSRRILEMFGDTQDAGSDDDQVDDAGARPPVLVSAATDGETYGHHHKFTEMSLARVFELSEANGIFVENFASWLARMPATHDVELVAPSSWSCAHGVERWRSNCGCRMDGSRPPQQEWRTPLRNALEALAARVHEVFERDGTALFGDPWAARDAYADVDVSDPTATRRFVAARLARNVSGAELQRARELLEMEHDTLRMFTSCAWFFDDIGGLEPMQVLRYASRAALLSGERATIEPPLLATLQTAQSSDPRIGTGADVYRRVTLDLDAPTRVAAATAGLVALGLDADDYLPTRAFTATFADGVATVTSSRTGGVHRYRVSITERELESLACDVTLLDDHAAPVRVTLADFPEKARHAIRAELRNALLVTCLTSDERRRLASGEVSLRDLAGEALVRAVHALREPEWHPAALSVGRLLDLLRHLETTIPFDAQTAFWEMWQAAPPERRRALAALHERFGFTTVQHA